MAAIVQLDKVSKFFGTKIVLQDIDISINKGECLCLVGANGAGKSTILNILLGIINPSAGDVNISGETYAKKNNVIKGRVGCMPEKSLLIEDITGADFLMLHGLLLSLDKKKVKQRVADLVALFFDDQTLINNYVFTYSTGNKKRLELCAALLNSPEIIILDEPFNGLDPVFVDKLIKIIKSLLQIGKTFIISSHDLSYVKELATDIALISEGKIVTHQKKENFYEQGESVLQSFFKYLPKEQLQQNELSLPQWI